MYINVVKTLYNPLTSNIQIGCSALAQNRNIIFTRYHPEFCDINRNDNDNVIFTRNVAKTFPFGFLNELKRRSHCIASTTHYAPSIAQIAKLSWIFSFASDYRVLRVNFSAIFHELEQNHRFERCENVSFFGYHIYFGRNSMARMEVICYEFRFSEFSQRCFRY